MKITKTTNSRLNTSDFTNLPFGRVFSDHMLVCNYKENNWQEAEILPYGTIQMNPGTQVFHYGQSVFEGMKAFKNDKGEVFVIDGGDQPDNTRSRVIIFDKDGNVTDTFNAALGADEKNLGHDIAVGPDDAVYVADAWSNSIRKYSKAK